MKDSSCVHFSVRRVLLRGPAEVSKDVTEDPSVEDEKRRNYGGVYVGLPADLTTVAASQSKSTHKGFCIFIHLETSREDVSVLSLAHHTLKKKKKSQASTLSLNGGCGQLARAPRTLPRGVMGGTGIRSGGLHMASIITFHFVQKEKREKKIWASKQTSPPTPTPTHPPWDWQLWVATAGIVTAILAPRSRHWNTLFLSLRRRQGTQPTQ
ncbi:Overexpressed in colon carcinoma 1 protein-like protein [Larimichthys crocea]|uniref:Uncharacterized protein n=1 Tax=Larimichthys crocea TaxID=215358 RepID=A0ACD3QEG3_LARCR|nr:Overexpressed in colon carcinoma 1 protein-like protein [Larimichthys crocea]